MPYTFHNLIVLHNMKYALEQDLKIKLQLTIIIEILERTHF